MLQQSRRSLDGGDSPIRIKSSGGDATDEEQEQPQRRTRRLGHVFIADMEAGPMKDETSGP